MSGRLPGSTQPCPNGNPRCDGKREVEQRYPMLVPEGKLRGYWLIAPGVYQPPCGFSMTNDGWACRLPRWHDGPHHMELVKSKEAEMYGHSIPTYGDEPADVIGEIDASANGNVILRVGRRRLHPQSSDYTWPQSAYVVLNPDEAAAMAYEMLEAVGLNTDEGLPPRVARDELQRRADADAATPPECRCPKFVTQPHLHTAGICPDPPAASSSKASTPRERRPSTDGGVGASAPAPGPLAAYVRIREDVSSEFAGQTLRVVRTKERTQRGRWPLVTGPVDYLCEMPGHPGLGWFAAEEVEIHG